ncbi:hypothetical protein ASG66_16535 [Bacillus sp. Leaf406]|nr:hypothetical protein ASG66_16535 [Bacillus sp. Leaf406]
MGSPFLSTAGFLIIPVLVSINGFVILSEDCGGKVVRSFALQGFAFRGEHRTLMRAGFLIMPS